MKSRNMLSVVAVCVLMCILSATAGAAITVHTDLDSWRSSLGSYDTETFNDLVLNPGLSVTTDNGSFSGNLWADRLVPGVATTTWTFDAPISAWGAGFWNLAGPGGQGLGIQVYLDGVAVPFEIPSSQSTGFWGVTSSTAFTQVLLTTGTQGGVAETYNMDNMSYSIATVPVPGAFVLGLLGVGVTSRLRKRRML